MDYIQVTVLVRTPVKKDDLTAYEATDLDEAVKNQREWYEADMIFLGELMDDNIVSVDFAAFRDEEEE